MVDEHVSLVTTVAPGGDVGDPTIAAEFDGGAMDCGSGLLLLLTRNLRGVSAGEVLAVRTEEPSVPPDLHDWARLAGHAVVSVHQESPAGPWRVLVRRGGESATVQSPFSEGPGTPLGRRLWMYSNFHCNLACSYCCAASSPKASPRLLSVELARQAAAEFAELGGAEIMVTGGEPFLHPEIGAWLEAVSSFLPTTVLTNGMVYDKGRRLVALEALDRDRVVFQISLDSAGPALHDAHRGAGSHALAIRGISQARAAGFRVRVAATLHENETSEATVLHARLDELGIAPDDRVIRPVAKQGFADEGLVVTIDDLEPEPTLAADGLWWHPVAITDPTLQVTPHPLPLAEGLATIRDTVAVQDAARREGKRHVFRCA